jgi:UDP-glucose 4-epimerase
MARYLITGGAGFLGSHLAEWLLAAGHKVMLLDDLSTGSIENIEHLKGHPGLLYRIDSVANAPLLAECVDWADAVFHLAAAVGVELIVSSPVRTIETNVYLTELLLTQAAKKRKKVLLASTSEVYGKSAKVPFAESDDLVLGEPQKGRWSYACSKLLDEFLCLAYGKEKEVPVVIARLFNTVGPRQTGRYGMVLPRFIDQALAGGPITVYGDGTQTRCFTYVGDVVSALARLVEETRAVGEIVNLGGTEEVTIRALAERVRARVGDLAVEIVLVPYDRAYEKGFEDMARRVPDIAKARRLVGFEPTLGLDEIIDRVVAWKRAERAGREAPKRPAEASGSAAERPK